MKLQKLQINGFGNLENKKIDFAEKINLVYGENESGKSTLLKCITNLFYGSSKNKKGKEISDFEKYKPWKAEAFSASLRYQLDDKKTYEVFRDFTKKNPSIYNEQGEDISKQFCIDKTKGNLFFTEQTGLEEEAFLSSLAVLQQEVKIEKAKQSTIIQKIANLASTGNDTISFKSAMNRLNKKLLEEVGTTRSQERPLNQVLESKAKIEEKEKELENIKEEQEELGEEKQYIEKQQNEMETKWSILQEWKQEKQRQEIEQKKNQVQTNRIEEQEEQIENLEKQAQMTREEVKKQTRKKKKTKQNTILTVIYAFFTVAVISSFFLFSFSVVTTVLLGIWLISTIVSACLFLMKKKEQEKKEKIERERRKQELVAIQAKIEVIQKDKEEQIAQLEQEKAEEYERQKKVENKIKSQHGEDTFVIDLFRYSLEELEEVEKDLSQKRNTVFLQKQRMELQEKENTKKLEKLAMIQEKKVYLEEQEKELKKKSDSLLLAKESMEKAYQEMQETVTPKFTQELSKAIAIISKGKYSKVKLNTQEGLVVALPTGEYKKVELLSAGTIDQLYLALRLAILKEITKENMPIFLDESFAFYDKERLKSVLTYLSKEIENQVVILTCSKREEEILKESQISYHKILI